jgi:hypothetical protein
MRRRVLQHDLDMYHAISGARPAVPLPKEPVPRMVKVPTAAKARPWSPMVLAIHLGNFCSNRLPTRVMKPEMADWVRRLSGQALERLQEAQMRLSTSREVNASRFRSDPPQMI